MQRLILLLCLYAGTALASDSERLQQAGFAPTLESSGSRLHLKNQAVLEYLWLDVYAAAFYSEARLTPRQALQAQASQRLELYYFQSIRRDDVLEAAWTTLQRQHSPATLDALRPELERLHESFRDIAPGDRYALIYSKPHGLQLERNGQVVFSSPDSRLAQAYFGIWLAPQGLSDELREALLAQR
ncbi:chalcone isomerase family protein [Pseudomonas sp. N040]|uniref:chalcone isomerase family protein n=1 Tax=Pseudomonas sp. N040 TaxID=2785325 RepID=UPI0018A2FD1C|nr:chalcone isomerase family protein [Pseudomonas sp. N040]MBF7731319.1 chalcone isomerase family protein [Pseudomonas sp. N040]MBW7014962.1 chalcone isomerase family protein [Pseudomonas sp. N040]